MTGDKPLLRASPAIVGKLDSCSSLKLAMQEASRRREGLPTGKHGHVARGITQARGSARDDCHRQNDACQPATEAGTTAAQFAAAAAFSHQCKRGEHLTGLRKTKGSSTGIRRSGSTSNKSNNSKCHAGPKGGLMLPKATPMLGLYFHHTPQELLVKSCPRSQDPSPGRQSCHHGPKDYQVSRPS